jgi:hypothetical protein
MAYSKEVREMAVALYAEGKSSYVISAQLSVELSLIGAGGFPTPNASTIQKWLKDAGVSRTISDANRLAPLKSENGYVKQTPDVKAQHSWMRRDFPAPLGVCEMCGERPATDRMRIDHTLFPYDPAFVVLSCRTCNRLHDYNKISITFFCPFDGNWYCASKVQRGRPGIPGDVEITRVVGIWDWESFICFGRY